MHPKFIKDLQEPFQWTPEASVIFSSGLRGSHCSKKCSVGRLSVSQHTSFYWFFTGFLISLAEKCCQDRDCHNLSLCFAEICRMAAVRFWQTTAFVKSKHVKSSSLTVFHQLSLHALWSSALPFCKKCFVGNTEDTLKPKLKMQQTTKSYLSYKAFFKWLTL